MALRRTQAMLTARSGGHDGDFHDKAGQFHFLVKSKRGWVNPELVAIVADPSTKLVPFLERVTPRPLSPLGKPQSLTVVDDGRSSATGTEKYQAVFGDQKKITCTVAVDRSGKRVSVHWSRAHERESGS